MKHFSEAEKERAIELYFAEKLTIQEVVTMSEYPARQNLERWLKKDERYADITSINVPFTMNGHINTSCFD